jgi:hypothetical protein
MVFAAPHESASVQSGQEAMRRHVRSSGKLTFPLTQRWPVSPESRQDRGAYIPELMSMARAYLVFSDIEGKLDVLRVDCARCQRKGRYSVRRLIERYGRNANMMKWKP